MPERKLVVVRSPFFSGPRMVGVGEVWDASDAIVKSYPNAFSPLEIKSSVENAPAVRRTTPRATRKSPATKKSAKKS